VNEGVERPALDPADIKPGLRVYVPRLRAEAEIVEVLGGGQLRVAAGPLKLSTTVAEVRSLAPAAKGRERAPEPRPAAGDRKDRRGRGPAAGPLVDFDAAADPDVPIQTSDNTVDLRGLRAHEATAMAEQFLDRTLGAGRRVAFLIHGHGTGALRDAVREALRTSSYVARMRPGEPAEGGDGVTVVWLRW
jgi:DNA mismatch repair protein MutS2